MRAIANFDGDEPPKTTDYVQLRPASTVTITRPSFVYAGRIPMAGVTLMVGREGMSKTALLVWIFARLTRGDLDGCRFGHPSDVVYIGREDDYSSVLVPRLVAAGADLSRVFFIELPGDADFMVSADVDALSTALDGITPALVALDPMDAHLGGSVDTHRKAEVQSTVARLAMLAQRHRCAVIGLAHMNKGDSRDVLNKVVGSVGFTTSVRSVLAVGEHPDDPTERVLVLRKANMTDVSQVPAVRYRVETAMVPDPSGGDPIDTAKVVVIGEEAGIDANSILSIPDAEERGARAEAAEWLTDVLENGPAPAKEVKTMASEADIAVRTLQRARRDLGVIVERDEHARGRPSSWRLPGSVPPLSGQIPCGTNGTKPDVAHEQGFPAGVSVSCLGANRETGTEELPLAVADAS